MKNHMKGNKGITLIALVITIIVLLLLAGVIIVTLTGDNGIFKKAIDSKKAAERASLYEEVGLAYTEYKSQIEENNSLESYLNNIPNARVEKLAQDTWCVMRNDESVTVSEDGNITEGRVDVWDGTSVECPEIKRENEKWNWYIYTAEQFKFYADFVNNGNSLTESLQSKVEEAGYNTSDVILNEESTVYLMNNLDLGSRPKNGEWETEENNAKKWIPIGYTKEKALIAKFEGNNNSISGIYVNGEQFVGLFGASDNSISNLIVKSSYIKGSDGVGGIVGIQKGGNLENCHNDNTKVVGTGRIIGGIVGQIATDVINCTNSGIIMSTTTTTNSQLGGIVGRTAGNAETNVINNCVNNGKVVASNICVGGIVGYCKVNISNCINNSTVESTYNGIVYIGGIAGYSYENVNITNCNNFGNISGVNTVGGIAGFVKKGNIKDCSNNGNIYATEPSAGGILGAAGENTKTEYCANAGEIDGNLNSGGIVGVGFQSSEITKCRNSAQVKGTDNVGGIIGDLYTSGKVSECENSGKVEGTNKVGGIIGEGYHSISISNSKNIAEINGDNNVGGISGIQYNEGSITDCENASVVNGAENVGGIAGAQYSEGSITDCKNAGGVNGAENVGGIVGCIANTVTRCYNTGNVTATNVDVGGIVGTSVRACGHNITYCFNAGNVEGKGDVGGINGYLGSAGANPKAEKCFNRGILTVLQADGKIGEIAAHKSNDAQISNCYFLKTTVYETEGKVKPQSNGAEEVEVDLKTFEEFLTWIENQQ